MDNDRYYTKEKTKCCGGALSKQEEHRVRFLTTAQRPKSSLKPSSEHLIERDLVKVMKVDTVSVLSVKSNMDLL